MSKLFTEQDAMENFYDSSLITYTVSGVDDDGEYQSTNEEDIYDYEGVIKNLYAPDGMDGRLCFEVEAYVNGELAGRVSGFDDDSIAEQWHKLENAIDKMVIEQFESQSVDYDMQVKYAD